MLLNKKKAFTLIELIVVIAILAILAVALIPLINNFIEKSRISTIMTTAATLETAAVAFNADVASFPDDEGDTFSETELVVDPSKANWDGPYLNRTTDGVSPWGSEMFLDKLNMSVGDENRIEYIFTFEDTDEANVPDASIRDIDKKMDGSVTLDSGKFQSVDEGLIDIVIITDAFGEDGDGNGDGPPPIGDLPKPLA